MIRYEDLSKHIEKSLKLYNEYILKTTATFYTDKLDVQEFEKIVLPSSDLYESYAILDDEVFLGYIFYFSFNPRQAYRRTAEVTIYLVDDAKGKNIAKDALKFIESRAVLKGIKNFLAKITSENERSINFFRSNGYSCVGELIDVGEKFGKILSVNILQKQL